MKKTISADVDASLAEELEDHAAASGISLSRLLAGILDEWARANGIFPRSIKTNLLKTIKTGGIPWGDL